MLPYLSSLWNTSKRRKLESNAMSKRRIFPAPSKDDEDPPPPPPFPTGDVNIDGANGHGGGQIIRNSVALSSVRKRSVTVKNIRAARPNPGLQWQHLASVKLVAKIASAQLKGAEPRSKELHMSRPHESSVQHRLPLRATVRTAGATTLVLQAALPAALRYLSSVDVEKQEHTLLIDGGTTTLHAPTSDYVERVLIPNLRHFGINMTYSVIRHGFFPKGGGQCVVAIDKSECFQEGRNAESQQRPKRFLRPCELRKRGNIVAIEGNIIVAGTDYINFELGDYMRKAVVKEIRTFLNGKSGYPLFSQDNISIQTIAPSEAEGKCLSITLTARTESDSVLGAQAIWVEKGGKKNKGKTPRDIQKEFQEGVATTGTEVAEDLCKSLETGAAVDVNMADQICVFMGMAKGTSKVLIPKPSDHLKSALDVCHEFNINIRIEEGDGGDNCMLVCDGMAMDLI